MRKATTRGLLACLVVAGLLMVPVMIAAPGATATPRAVAASSRDSHDKFEGKITSVNAGKHTFKMNDHHRGIVKIKANSSTRYEHLSGFGALHKGLKVDVKAHKTNGKWVADKIDRSSSSHH